MSNSPLLHIQNLEISTIGSAKSSKALVKRVSFDLFANEVLCIVGESGSGKSLTSSSIMGLLPKDQLTVSHGQILLKDRALTQLSNKEWGSIRGQQISMIFQEPMTALNPVMTVGRQVEEVLEKHTNLNPQQRKQKVLDVFAQVLLPTPEKIYSAYPFQISGGQRQRVMIAMALILEPDILIADEPTTALDVTTQAQILSLIKDLQKRLGIGVLFITHDFGVVAEIADRIIVMSQGEIVEQGIAEKILNAPEHPYTRTLIAAIPHTPKGVDAIEKPEPILTVTHISKTYGTSTKRAVPALKDINFTLHAGEIVGLVGESGSGKSTLGRIIVGLQPADSGSVVLDNTDLLQLSHRELRAHRRHIQMVFQDPYASLNPRHTVLEAIIQGPIAYGVSKKTAIEEAIVLLEKVGLDASCAERYPHQFSGGQRQRIGIARALALKPKILVADEAVSALDVSVQAQVLQLIKNISKDYQLAVLFITHDLRVAAELCDRIAVLEKGHLVEIEKAMDVFHQPQHPYTQKLIGALPGKNWIKPDLVISSS